MLHTANAPVLIHAYILFVLVTCAALSSSGYCSCHSDNNVCEMRNCRIVSVCHILLTVTYKQRQIQETGMRNNFVSQWDPGAKHQYGVWE